MTPARSLLALAPLLVSGFAAAQLQPQAIYPLQTDLLDVTANYGPITLYGSLVSTTPANGICLNGLYLFGATPGEDLRTPVITTLNTSDFQFSFEFSITSLGPNNRPVVMGGHLWRFLGLYVQPNGLVGIKHNNSNYAWSTATTVATGTWYSATVKYENGTAEVYIDGVQALSASVGVLSTSTNLNFCTNDYSNGAAFHGCVRSLAIANDTTLGTTAGAFPYGSGCDGLVLGANGAPTLGNATFELALANVPAVSPLAFFAFGSSAVNPGVDLGVIGMTGCFSYTAFDLGLFGPSVVIGGTATFALPIPNVPALTGTLIASQGVSFSAANPAGLASSNGLQLVLAP
jgi:hypothetical protein